MLVALGATITSISGAQSACNTATGSGPGVDVADIPASLMVIYEQAAGRYQLGADGWAYLASVNYEETDFDNAREFEVNALFDDVREPEVVTAERERDEIEAPHLRAPFRRPAPVGSEEAPALSARARHKQRFLETVLVRAESLVGCLCPCTRPGSRMCLGARSGRVRQPLSGRVGIARGEPSQRRAGSDTWGTGYEHGEQDRCRATHDASAGDRPDCSWPVCAEFGQLARRRQNRRRVSPAADAGSAEPRP